MLLSLGLAASSALSAPTYRDCAVCPEMTIVPAPAGERDGDATGTYAVASAPTTFREWEHCLLAGGCAGYQPDRQGWSLDSPAVNVSYDDAETYVAWLRRATGRSYRLVRENEWAWLALGGRSSAFPWGDALGAGNANCLGCGSPWDGRRASPVRSFGPNAFGLYDMVGNIAHWLEPPSTGASRCSGKPFQAAIFGAAWSERARYLDVAQGSCMIRLMRDDAIGFRVAVEGPRAMRSE